MVTWIKPHDDELRTLHAQGLSFAEIANALTLKFNIDRTRNATIGRAVRIGLVRNLADLKRDRTRAAIKREADKRARRRFSASPGNTRELTGLPPVKRSTIPAGSTASRVIGAIKGRKASKAVPATERDTRPLRCVEIEPKHLTLMELSAETCRYPFGGWPSNDPITFCGHWCPKDRPYCFDHQRLVIGVGTSSERAAHHAAKDRAA